MVCEMRILFIHFFHYQQATMPIQSSIEEKQALRKVYRQQYYQKHKGRYATSFQKKREGTYLCATCNKVLKLVSKSAHEKTQKHVYAYYTGGRHANV